jgi:hypothetical protein
MIDCSVGETPCVSRAMPCIARTDPINFIVKQF